MEEHTPADENSVFEWGKHKQDLYMGPASCSFWEQEKIDLESGYPHISPR
ncbi:hypothetical protein [Ruminococcus flavefaciens]|nr:hypothetical protein [Ruminococcus flavefaciens]